MIVERGARNVYISAARIVCLNKLEGVAPLMATQVWRPILSSFTLTYLSPLPLPLLTLGHALQRNTEADVLWYYMAPANTLIVM